MLLDIIIPQYSEDEEVLQRLLSSINNQMGFDLKQLQVTIVNDHSDTKLSEDFLNTFKRIQINYIERPENGGPGQARQYGLDNTSADYLTFMDADDMLFSNFTLMEVFNAIAQQPEMDVYCGQMIEEALVGNQIQFIPKDTGVTWMHGKFFRRKAIEERKIHFDAELRIHEDIFFNASLMIGNPKIVKLQSITYVWCYNPKSITRSMREEYSLSTAPLFNHALDMVIDRLILEKNPSAGETAVSTLLNGYYLSQTGVALLDDHKEMKAAAEKSWYHLYKKFGHFLEELDDNTIAQMQQIQRQEAMRGGFISERETFFQFVNRVTKENKRFNLASELEAAEEVTNNLES